MEKSFKINEYITLKLEENKTVIYVKKKQFLNCKHILLNLSIEDLENINGLKSIDDIIEFKDKKDEFKKFFISQEVEFWGHCSSIQAWAENNYDTNLLDTRLAFPLLKKLTELHDYKANIIFKEEIVKRLKTGSYRVKRYLIDEHYLNYLSQEEIMNGLLSIEEYLIMEKVLKSSNKEYNLINSFDDDKFRHKNILLRILL